MELVARRIACVISTVEDSDDYENEELRHGRYDHKGKRETWIWHFNLALPME
jgi:hypothetical protein